MARYLGLEKDMESSSLSNQCWLIEERTLSGLGVDSHTFRFLVGNLQERWEVVRFQRPKNA